MESKEDSSENSVHSRSSLKTHPIFNNYQLWKLKLRENCYRRVREDRKRLIWKMRDLPNSQPLNSRSSEGLIKSAFEEIVSDELKKLKGVSSEENKKTSIHVLDIDDDVLWEYDGLDDAYQGDCEEILLEMQRIFYKDLTTESTNFNGRESYVETWEDEEDEYLAHAVYEHMQLNEKQLQEEVIWCPVCKRGQLQENSRLIYCTICNFNLKKDDKVDLAVTRVRLAEVHAEHLDRGCKLKPKFSMETRFGLTALYITCTGCCTFDVVM